MSIEHLKTYLSFANISRLSPDFLWLLKMVTLSNDGKEKDHPSKPKILRNPTESLLYLPEDPHVHYRDSTNCPIFQRVVGFPKYRNEATKNLHRKQHTSYQRYLCIYLNPNIDIHRTWNLQPFLRWSMRHQSYQLKVLLSCGTVNSKPIIYYLSIIGF